jgi:hypothetical protein
MKTIRSVLLGLSAPPVGSRALAETPLTSATVDNNGMTAMRRHRGISFVANSDSGAFGTNVEKGFRSP